MQITTENLDQLQIRFDDRGLVAAIVQNIDTGSVLMLGYMNRQSLQQTLATRKVTFYSRSRQELWVKGETSGNYLDFKAAFVDCDQDAVLVLAEPLGPTCHTGSLTCFGERENEPFLPYLQNLIHDRKGAEAATSYTAKLFALGVDKIAQKVGEEAVELVIEAKNEDRDKFMGEAADLLYHYLVLLAHKGYSLDDVVALLRERHGR